MRPTIEDGTSGNERKIHFMVYNPNNYNVQYHRWDLTDGTGDVVHLYSFNQNDIFREAVWLPGRTNILETSNNVKIYDAYMVGSKKKFTISGNNANGAHIVQTNTSKYFGVVLPTF